MVHNNAFACSDAIHKGFTVFRCVETGTIDADYCDIGVSKLLGGLGYIFGVVNSQSSILQGFRIRLSEELVKFMGRAAADYKD